MVDSTEIQAGSFRHHPAVGGRSNRVTGVDGRTAGARRLKTIRQSITEQLGGRASLSEGQAHLVETLSGLLILRSNLDAKALKGEPVATAEYVRVSNSVRRLLIELGIQSPAPPRPIDATPAVVEHIRGL